MRGLQEKRGAGVKFLGIANNSICESSKVPREGFTLVESKDREGATHVKYCKFYDRVEALIMKIEWSEREWRGKVFRSWRLSLDADGTPCVLELPTKSRVTNRFLKLAENIDFLRPVEFAAWQDKTTGNTAFMVGQRVNEDDEKAVSVPQKYTKDNPGACPQPKQRMGGKEWDWNDQEDFLYNLMVTVIIPRVEAAHGSKEIKAEIDSADAPERDPEYPYDDTADF